jgi:hypothetical protein
VEQGFGQLRIMIRLALVWLVASSAMAFQGSHMHLKGLTQASAQRGTCTRMSAGSSGSQGLQRPSRRAALALVLIGAPAASFAKDKKGAAPAKPAEEFESISLDDFYAALEDQEVLKVEFDGPKFEVSPLPDVLLCDCVCLFAGWPLALLLPSAYNGRLIRGQSGFATCIPHNPTSLETVSRTRITPLVLGKCRSAMSS